MKTLKLDVAKNMYLCTTYVLRVCFFFDFSPLSFGLVCFIKIYKPFKDLVCDKVFKEAVTKYLQSRADSKHEIPVCWFV